MNKEFWLNKPMPRKVYTLEEVYQLSLSDLPCLQIADIGVIQDAHITPAEMLSILDFKDTKWMYIGTTREGIPVFHYCLDNPPYSQYVDTAPYMNEVDKQTGLLWVTPKGFPNIQQF